MLAIAVAIAIGLWEWPLLAFRNPGVNDAMTLADLTLPVVGVILLTCMVAVVFGYVRRWSAVAPVALGAFLVGVGLVFVIALVSIGNMSDDRFAPFLFLPIPFGLAGMLALIFGLTRGTLRSTRSGLVIGGIATVLLLIWILARGARDWLLAPYGFDVMLLIGLGAAVVFLLGLTKRQSDGGSEVAAR